MEQNKWVLAKQLFAKVITIPSDERASWIERECRDEEVRLELHELLEAHDVAGSAPDPSAPEEGPGVVIDRYKLLQQIGEGGFGTVYMALQREPVERRVALKIIRRDMDSGQVIARFEAERQAIALMDHPNIARVYDAGATATGKPYFVMELVMGAPITEYCDQRRLSPKERLALFVQVCHGVQHAHQKGIIHRDLKPSNVLVAEYDHKAVPKIIDFGVAKATADRLTKRTIFTEFGQLVGTLEYMSPEQAKLNQIDVDTRSDVYSLGVLLYELLTGTTPFPRRELASQGFDEVLRIIREVEPPRPSTRVTTLASASVEGERGSQALSRLLRGDLDWIVMRSLDKERNRRYGSAENFAEDIERYLAGDVVRARPPSASYKLRKFVRRHRGPVVAASLLVLMLILGLAGTGVGFKQALDSERDAVSARESQRQLTVRMAMERGLGLCEEGNVAPGMLWLGRALAMAPPGDVVTRRVIRANLNAWRTRLNTLEVVLPHDAPVICAGYHPDGTQLVTGTADGGAHVWDLATGTRSIPPVAHGSDVHGIAFNGDGSWALTTTLRSEARFWNTRTGKTLAQLGFESAGGEPVSGAQDAAIRGPEERQVVTSHRCGAIRIWDAQSGRLLHEFPSQRHAVHSVDVSDDGKRLVTACHDGDACVWDLDSRRLLGRFRHGPQARVSAAALLDPDGARVVTGGSDGTVFVWSVADAMARGDRTLDARKGEVASTLPPHAGAVHRMHASADRTRIITASFDNTVRIFDLSGEVVHEAVIDHPSSVEDAAFHPDGTRIATASDDRLARIWRLAPSSSPGRRAYPSEAQQAVYSAGGRYVLVVSDAGIATVFDTSKGDEVTRMPHEAGVRAMAVSADRSICVTGSARGQLRIWDIAGRRFRVEPKFESGGIWSVAISPDGTRVAIGDFSGLLQVLDARTGKRLTLPRPIGRRVFFVGFNPEGSHIVLGCDDQSAYIRRPLGTAPGLELKGHRSTVTTAAFSSDGSRLVTGSYDRTVRVWDVATGDPIGRPMRQSGTVFYVALAFSEDGRLVAVGCEDGTARLWDVESATPIGPILRHDSAVCMVSFARRGTLLAGSARGTVSTWKIVATPIGGGVEHVRLWLEVATGLVLEDDGTFRALDAIAWAERSRKLESLGGPPS